MSKEKNDLKTDQKNENDGHENTQRPPGDWQSAEPDPTATEDASGETSEKSEGERENQTENEDHGTTEIRV